MFMIRKFFKDQSLDVVNCNLCLGTWVYTALSKLEGKSTLNAFIEGMLASWMVSHLEAGVRLTLPLEL